MSEKLKPIPFMTEEKRQKKHEHEVMLMKKSNKIDTLEGLNGI